MCKIETPIAEHWRKESEFHDRMAAKDVREAAFRTYGLSNGSIQYARNLLGDLTGRIVLDLGCGDGKKTLPLLQEGVRVLACDISYRMATMALAYLKTAANEKGARLSCLQIAAEQMGIKSGAVDLVFGVSILHHLNIPLGLEEIHRILKPDGRAVFVEPLAHHPLANLYRALTPKRHSETESPLPYFILKDLGKLFRRANHREFYLSSVLAAFTAYLGSKSLFDGFLHILMKIDQALFDAFPQLRRYAWISVIELTK